MLVFLIRSVLVLGGFFVYTMELYGAKIMNAGVTGLIRLVHLVGHSFKPFNKMEKRTDERREKVEEKRKETRSK